MSDVLILANMLSDKVKEFSNLYAEHGPNQQALALFKRTKKLADHAARCKYRTKIVSELSEALFVLDQAITCLKQS